MAEQNHPEHTHSRLSDNYVEHVVPLFGHSHLASDLVHGHRIDLDEDLIPSEILQYWRELWDIEGAVG